MSHLLTPFLCLVPFSAILPRVINICALVGENLPSVSRIAFQPFRWSDAFWVVASDGIIGFFPVAFTVPQVARLICLPEGVCLGPHAVVEGHVSLTRVGAAAWQPAEVGEQKHVVALAELLPLVGGAGAGHGSVVLGCLVPVEGVEDGAGHAVELFGASCHAIAVGKLPLQLAGGVPGLVGGKTGRVSLELVKVKKSPLVHQEEKA